MAVLQLPDGSRVAATQFGGQWMTFDQETQRWKPVSADATQAPPFARFAGRAAHTGETYAPEGYTPPPGYRKLPGFVGDPQSYMTNPKLTPWVVDRGYLPDGRHAKTLQPSDPWTGRPMGGPGSYSGPERPGLHGYGAVVGVSGRYPVAPPQAGYTDLVNNLRSRVQPQWGLPRRPTNSPFRPSQPFGGV